MLIRDVEWPKGIRDKVERKHGLSQGDVESAVLDRHAFIKRAGADRHMLLGRSAEGAYLAVLVAYKAGTARIITARRMDLKERRIYRRAGK